MESDIVDRLRNAPWTTADDCNAAADEIERLRAERDDARALFCGLLECYKRGDGRSEAKKRGWFCFKENNND
jgi:hypothetical protein